jgi:hypothetical protein
MLLQWDKKARGIITVATLMFAASVMTGCTKEESFDPADPARGPGGMVGNGEPLTDGSYPAGLSVAPEARDVEPPSGEALPDCGPECQSFCASQELTNPVDRGMCASTWGVGLSTKKIVDSEACRRLFVDMLGRFPTYDEVESTCGDEDWDKVVESLMARERFVEINQRRWADALRYDTESVSVERIFDMDRLVGKLYRGKVPYDQFAAITSAHPILTRRHDTPGDRAEALFSMFMGRPPLGNERSDLGRLYNLWENGYYDHPELGVRLPDAHIRYRCLNESGEPDPNQLGECTSILYGYNELYLTPDLRAEEGDDAGQWTMWSGLLKADEWALLQMPGRLLSQQPTFWEKAVDDVLELYLGYDLGRQIPAVRDELVSHLLANNGDIRSLHHAVLTSQAYLQSATGNSERPYRWTWGPLKQVDAEVWIDTLSRVTGENLGDCDWRLNRPEDFLEQDRVTPYAMVVNSRWELDDEGNVKGDYRRLARTLGGCPSNDVGGRFKVLSILTTATQLNFVNSLCDPGQRGTGVPVKKLLPVGITPDRAVTPRNAQQIVRHQIETFYGRLPRQSEMEDASRHGEQCQREVCTAEEFARPACYATLSSAEMLFY